MCNVASWWRQVPEGGPDVEDLPREHLAPNIMRGFWHLDPRQISLWGRLRYDLVCQVGAILPDATLTSSLSFMKHRLRCLNNPFRTYATYMALMRHDTAVVCILLCAHGCWAVLPPRRFPSVISCCSKLDSRMVRCISGLTHLHLVCIRRKGRGLATRACHRTVMPCHAVWCLWAV